MKTAILVDGGFYRKRAKYLWGEKTAEERAKELFAYCNAHIAKVDGDEKRALYRVFYYDCRPIGRKTIYHPLTRKNIDLEKTETYEWTNIFYEQLKKRRKFALRMGELSGHMHYNLKADVTKDILSGKRNLEELGAADFEFFAQQKGVDMRIGIDIASLSYKRQVDQIILISGDSDFVPAAKLARREGIDFILDPMFMKVKDDLFEHIDGMETPWKSKKTGQIHKD